MVRHVTEGMLLKKIDSADEKKREKNKKILSYKLYKIFYTV
jgi:hypothetical protein